MILAITQARMGSSRLPGKVLMKAGSNTLLDMHMQRVKRSQRIGKHILAITQSAQDDVLEAHCIRQGYSYFRGDEADVLDRFYKAAQPHSPEIVVRLTADCPLIDASIVDQVIDCLRNSAADYASNTLEPTYPDGLDAEVFTMAALSKAWNEASRPSDREHVTPYIWSNSSLKGGQLFRSENISTSPDLSAMRLTVDEPEDIEVIRLLVQRFGDNVSWQQAVDFIKENSAIKNSFLKRNEGYTKSLNNDNT